jgi:alkanesulfonate monooxygenase SsuD/methylene tetrahydromethanopterin reductase-like flavin-dependent oxidoreductase (luciferase family)
MKIAIGLPAGIPQVPASLVFDWAKRAEAGSFSSLCAIDRLVYANYDPLITFANVAGVTQRIRLMTTVLIAPLHNAGILAKQAASLDALSHGRLTLGLGVGGREDDFRAAPASFHDRGKRFEHQLELMTRIWSGQPVDHETGPIGPAPVQPGGPEVLLGGSTSKAMERLARWGNGYMAGAWSRERTSQTFRLAEDVWRQAGRVGQTRLVGAAYYGLGQNADERTQNFLLNYYAFAGSAASLRGRTVLTTNQAIRTHIQAFTDIGTDELIFWPCIADLDQVNRLADLL